jgi:hypothetical protein
MRLHGPAGIELTPEVVHFRALEALRAEPGPFDRERYIDHYVRLTTWGGWFHVWVLGEGWVRAVYRDHELAPVD